MELRDYLHILARRWVIVLGISLLSFGGFAWYAQTRPISFEAQATVAFIKQAEPVTQTKDYRYDNYYVLQSGQLLMTLAQGWLTEGPFIKQIYTDAGVTLPAISVNRYDKLIKTRSLPGASLAVITDATTEQAASALANQATLAVSKRFTQLTSEQALDPVKVLTGTAVTQAKTTSVSTYAIAGLIFGLILGIILAFFVEYLTGNKPKK